jgi:murein L,D-transpeptidase YcbB/YkuD
MNRKQTVSEQLPVTTESAAAGADIGGMISEGQQQIRGEMEAGMMSLSSALSEVYSMNEEAVSELADQFQTENDALYSALYNQQGLFQDQMTQMGEGFTDQLEYLAGVLEGDRTTFGNAMDTLYESVANNQSSFNQQLLEQQNAFKDYIQQISGSVGGLVDSIANKPAAPAPAPTPAPTYNVTKPAAPTPTQTSTSSTSSLLKVGSRGSSVTDLQNQLRAAGYSIAADGIFGSQTQAAVIDFQRKNNLAVDGIVGSQTSGALSKITTSSSGGGSGTKIGGTSGTYYHQTM